MDRVSEFPKQDFEGMVAELWLGLNACLYHKAYVDVYANTTAMHEAGSRFFNTVTRPTLPQTDLNLLQEDLMVFRAHFAGVLWQLNHLGDELLRLAYRRGKQEGILSAARYDQLVKKLDDDPIREEIQKYRNMSHQFAGVIVTIHDSQSHAFIAHVLPPLGNNATQGLQDTPLAESEIRELELNSKLNSYCNHLGGYCEGLFKVIDAKYKRTVFPRSQGFSVTIPYSYQGQIPHGAKDVIYVRMDGSA